MTSDSGSPGKVDEEVRQLYERYQSAKSDEERHEIALDVNRLGIMLRDTRPAFSVETESPDTLEPHVLLSTNILIISTTFLYLVAQNQTVSEISKQDMGPVVNYSALLAC